MAKTNCPSYGGENVCTQFWERCNQLPKNELSDIGKKTKWKNKFCVLKLAKKALKRWPSFVLRINLKISAFFWEGVRLKTKCFKVFGDYSVTKIALKRFFWEGVITLDWSCTHLLFKKCLETILCSEKVSASDNRVLFCWCGQTEPLSFQESFLKKNTPSREMGAGDKNIPEKYPPHNSQLHIALTI